MSDDFEVVAGDFAAEVEMWDGISDALAVASRAAGGLMLDSKAFSAAARGTAAGYEAARSAVEGFLKGGASVIDGGSAALVQVRNSYNQTDSEVADTAKSPSKAGATGP